MYASLSSFAEVVKVRRQAQTSTLPSNVQLCPRGCGTFVLNNGLGDCLIPRNFVHYFDASTGEIKEGMRIADRGTFGTLRRIFVKEGIGGMYAGLAPTLTMGVPNTVIYFSFYDELSARLKKWSLSSTWTPALAGAAARTVATFSTAPLELIRTRQAFRVGNAEPAGGMLVEFRNIISQEGYYGLYKGLSPTLLRDVPFSAIYWYCIEECRRQWKNRQQAETISKTQQAGQALANGVISGSIASICTTPLDIIKTRQQLYTPEVAVVCDHKGAAVYNPRPPRSQANEAWTILQEILREEGVPGLWRGNVARMMKVAPSCAIMISSYEIGKRVLTEDL